MHKPALILLSVLFSTTQVLSQTQNINEPLSETPLYPVPSEMTFEEYQDMNRRISQAFLWSSIPLPGTTHYYAGEKKKAKQLFYIGLGGLACIIGGAISMEEGNWPDYNSDTHVIFNGGQDNEKRYEKIPKGMEGDITRYELRQIRKEQDGSGGGLIALGVLIIAGDMIYDRLIGLKKIEEKRDRVRFKYGKEMKFSFNPVLNLSQKEVGLGMNMNFKIKG